MDYEQAMEYIQSINRFGMKLGLDRIGKLLNMLGNPQENLKFVHIGGTNGKGSVTSFISQVLIESGYNVGMYTSPYLEKFNERIKVNGFNIEDDVLARNISMVRECCNKMDVEDLPTEFEIVTATAFLCFLEKKCDIVCLEVGLGGRFDATNSISDSLVSVITSISKDHTEILGETLDKIAYEKAGIIKNGGDVFLYDVGDESVCNEVKKVCRDRNASFNLVEFDSIVIKKSNLANQVFDFKTVYGDVYNDVKIRLAGSHQIKNAVLAFNVVEFLRRNKGLNISDESIKKGFANCRWAGRLEVVNQSPLVLLDGAHNSDSAAILSSEIGRNIDDTYYKVLVIGILKDKDVDRIIKEIVPAFDSVIITKPDSVRSMEVEDLAYRAYMYCENIICIEDPVQACEYALSLSTEVEVSEKKSKKGSIMGRKQKNNKPIKKKKAIVVCGSLYLVGGVRGLFIQE